MPGGEDILILLVIGVASGVVGGLLGFGGSILLIPLLHGLMDHPLALVQAAAMIVNTLIALPTVWMHERAKAIEWRIVGRMVPFGIAAIVVGVEVGNAIDQQLLTRIFAIFLAWVIVADVVKILRRRLGQYRHRPLGHEPGWPRASIIAAPVGFAAGVLGIGGGPIAVPLLQSVGHRTLKSAITASSALMCITATVGAVRKNLTLPTDLDPTDALRIASIAGPAAIVGAIIGATLTHRLPARWLRGTLLGVLAWSCYLMWTH